MKDILIPGGFNHANQQFNTFGELARYLAYNFEEGLKLLEDYTLYDLLEFHSTSLYHEVCNMFVDFKHNENILTVLLYLFDNDIGIITRHRRYEDNFHIANGMKSIYPNINEDVRVLFRDRTLSTIFNHKFTKTQDQRYKRHRDFVQNVEETNEHLFSYYYFLFSYLTKDENIAFTLDGIKFTSLNEMAQHMVNKNQVFKPLVQEMMSQDVILALLALEVGAGLVANCVKDNDFFAALRILNQAVNVDIKPILQNDVCIWMVSNYKNYEYNSDRAKKLSSEYKNIIVKEYMDFSELLSLFKLCSSLYDSFLEMFNHNKVISRKSEIIPIQEEYYLDCLYSGQPVSRVYLIDYHEFDLGVYNTHYALQVEKGIIIEELAIMNKDIVLFEEDFKQHEKLYVKHEHEIASSNFKNSLVILMFQLFTILCFIYLKINTVESLLLSIMIIPSLLINFYLFLHYALSYSHFNTIIKTRSNIDKDLETIDSLTKEIDSMRDFYLIPEAKMIDIRLRSAMSNK